MIMMRMWGVKPLPFRNGHEAMEWIECVSSGRYHEPLPEVALIDVRMPGPPGHHVGYQMRQTEQIRHIPIVMMTAFLFDREEEAHIRQMVCPDRFIKKPLPSPEELRIMLQSTIKAAKVLAS
jgi:CheY-like chemotaxis protein